VSRTLQRQRGPRAAMSSAITRPIQRAGGAALVCCRRYDTNNACFCLSPARTAQHTQQSPPDNVSPSQNTPSEKTRSSAVGDMPSEHLYTSYCQHCVSLVAIYWPNFSTLSHLPALDSILAVFSVIYLPFSHLTPSVREIPSSYRVHIDPLKAKGYKYNFALVFFSF